MDKITFTQLAKYPEAISQWYVAKKEKFELTYKSKVIAEFVPLKKSRSLKKTS